MKTSSPVASTKVIASWTLPNSAEQICLEVVKDADGFDSPRYNLGGLTWDDFAEPHARPLEDDQDYFTSVIFPQGREVMKNYFYRRARLNCSAAKLLNEQARKARKMRPVTPKKATR